MNKSFISTYFCNKSGDELKRTITPNWDEVTLKNHLNLIKVPKDINSAIEVGCGCGRLMKNIIEDKGCFMVGIDASQEMIDEGKKYLKDYSELFKLVKVDGEGKMKDIGHGFDFAYSIITFQHIPNTETVLTYIKNMYKSLRDGGELMFQVLKQDFNKGELWSYHDLDVLEKQLVELGAKDINIHHANKWAIFRCKK